MSGIGHAISKVFKAVGSVVKKVWKPLVIAAAVYFTGGAALGMMGAMSTGGGLLAGAGAGLEAAAGGLGIGAGAGIGGAFAAGAGADAAGLGAGALMGAPALADSGELVGAGGGLVDATGADLAGAPASLAGGGTGGFETLGGAGYGADVSVPGAENPYTYGSFTTNEPTTAMGPPSPGDPSSLWDKSLGIAKQVMTTPGMPSLIGGLLQSYNQGQMLNAQMNWQNARAPGQVTGGTKNAWNGMPNTNANLSASTTTPMPGAGIKPNTPMPAPQMAPYQPIGAPPMPGAGQPGSNAQRYPGYGLPGYGQQQPVNQQQAEALQQMQAGGLMQTPFIDSPYDQSYA